MYHTRMILSSSDMFSTLHTTSREVRSSCILEERPAWKVDFRTCKLGVSTPHQVWCFELIITVIQILMEKFNGIGVILENRYYGKSYPYKTSTTDELRFLTTEQSEDHER
jgi:hypothetical protein